ncbi:MAG: hypothetical protein RR222_23100 [Pseudomonas sp.]|uniref:hypothetical protein n=1 Tax=Pseudomonas sp. TaxID=306 RepID=UPI002FC5C3EB
MYLHEQKRIDFNGTLDAFMIEGSISAKGYRQKGFHYAAHSLRVDSANATAMIAAAAAQKTFIT